MRDWRPGMAHMMKLKSGAAGAMLDHYERKAELECGYERANIDPERTRLNYVELGNVRSGRREDVADSAGLVRAKVREGIESHEASSGKRVRKDANVLVDWVVTLPPDVRPGDERRFFSACVRFCKSRYGSGNVVGGFVHMDEATPHVHIPVVPLRDGRLVASKVVDRADLRTFHADLSAAVEEALGYRASVELDDARRGERLLSRLSQPEYRAAKDELRRARSEAREARSEAREAEDRRDRAQEGAEAAQERLDGLTEAIGEAEGRLAEATAAADGEQDRLECLRRARGEAEGRVADLEERVREARGRAGRLARAVEDARSGFESLRAKLIEGLRAAPFAPAGLSDIGRELARRLGVGERPSTLTAGAVGTAALKQRAAAARAAMGRAARGRGEGGGRISPFGGPR